MTDKPRPTDPTDVVKEIERRTDELIATIESFGVRSEDGGKHGHKRSKGRGQAYALRDYALRLADELSWNEREVVNCSKTWLELYEENARLKALAANLSDENKDAAKEVARLKADHAPHMCQMDHPKIRHWDSENEMCPMCRLSAEVERLKNESEDYTKEKGLDL